MTKDELLKAIRRDRTALDEVVARVPDDRLTARVLDQGWSVKDVLAHVSAWERLCARWLEAAARSETPERPEVRDVDGTNARFYEEACRLALADVIAGSRRSHEAIVRAVEALPDAELTDERRFGWPAWQLASANSDEHYREHAQQIERWLAEDSAQPAHPQSGRTPDG